MVFDILEKVEMLMLHGIYLSYAYNHFSQIVTLTNTDLTSLSLSQNGLVKVDFSFEYLHK